MDKHRFAMAVVLGASMVILILNAAVIVSFASGEPSSVEPLGGDVARQDPPGD